MVTYVHSYRHTYMQTVGPETSFKPGLGAMEIACNAMEIAAKQTLCEEGLSYGKHRMLWKFEAWLGWRQALRLWKLPLMLWKVHLARQASKQASRLWKLPWMR